MRDETHGLASGSISEERQRASMHTINTNVRTTKQISYRTPMSSFWVRARSHTSNTLSSHQQPPESYFSLRSYELHTVSTISPARYSTYVSVVQPEIHADREHQPHLLSGASLGNQNQGLTPTVPALMSTGSSVSSETRVNGPLWLSSTHGNTLRTICSHIWATPKFLVQQTPTFWTGPGGTDRPALCKGKGNPVHPRSHEGDGALHNYNCVVQ